MTRYIKKILFSAMVFLCINSYSQNVGINGTGAAPDGGAMLDVASTNKGLLVPRVNIANLATIAPIVGSTTVSMLVYNTNAGTGLGYHYWDGANWVRFSTGNPLVDNGLYFNGGANRVRLGGPLVENTTITQGTFGMTWNLSSTGDFNIQDNGTTRFSVQDNGRTTVGGVLNAGQFNVTGNSYFSDDIRLRDGAVNAGDILVRIYDSADDGIVDIYENNAYNIRLHGNGTSVFNEQGIATSDFRVESSGNANMLLIDAGTNRVGVGKVPAQALDVQGNVRFSGALMPNNQAGTANMVLLSGGAGVPPVWGNQMLNTPATTAMGKFFSGAFNIPTGTSTLTLADANCVISSTCSMTWVGPLPAGPNYAFLLVTYQAQAGQWVFHFQNNTGFNLNNFQFSYFAAY